MKRHILNYVEFKGTYFEEVYNILKDKFGEIGRVRILMKHFESCLSWHRDHGTNTHANNNKCWL